MTTPPITPGTKALIAARGFGHHVTLPLPADVCRAIRTRNAALHTTGSGYEKPRFPGDQMIGGEHSGDVVAPAR